MLIRRRKLNELAFCCICRCFLDSSSIWCVCLPFSTLLGRKGQHAKGSFLRAPLPSPPHCDYYYLRELEKARTESHGWNNKNCFPARRQQSEGRSSVRVFSDWSQASLQTSAFLTWVGSSEHCCAKLIWLVTDILTMLCWGKRILKQSTA